MSLTTPGKIRELQIKLYRKTKNEPEYRFYLLYDKIYREDVLAHAYALARANQGAPEVDGQTFEQIESAGLEEWLTGIRQELRNKTYRPWRCGGSQVEKPGGEQPLGFRVFGTGWCRPQPRSCWNRYSRQIWNQVPMVTDRSEARRTPFGKCIS